MRQQLADLTNMVQQQQQEIRRLSAAEQAGAPANLAALMQQQAALLRQQRELDNERQQRLEVLLRRDRARPSLVDAKGIGRPEKFGSKEAEWRIWAIKLENVVAGVFPGARDALAWAQERDPMAPVTAADRDAYFQEDGEANEEIIELDNQLYTVLLGLVDGEGFDLIINSQPRSGLEAWRRLAHRFDPTTAGRRRNLLKNVLQPGVFPNDQLRDILEEAAPLPGRGGVEPVRQPAPGLQARHRLRIDDQVEPFAINQSQQNRV